MQFVYKCTDLYILRNTNNWATYFLISPCNNSVTWATKLKMFFKLNSKINTFHTASLISFCWPFLSLQIN